MSFYHGRSFYRILTHLTPVTCLPPVTVAFFFADSFLTRLCKEEKKLIRLIYHLFSSNVLAILFLQKRT